MINDQYFDVGFSFTIDSEVYTIMAKVSDDEQLYKVHIESDLYETSYTKYLTYAQLVYIIYSRTNN